MRIRVKFFAMVREALGLEGCELSLAPGVRATEARERLMERYVALRDWMDQCRLAVNLEYQPWDVRLHDGDELYLIPPVSGG